MAQKPKNEEKFYTPQEVAVAVLAKAHEILKKSKLAKANSSHEIEIGEEPHNDEAEAPEYLASADIENSGAHGEKKGSKKPSPAGADKDGDGDIDGDDAMASADKDGDGDLDGDDAMEAEEEATGEDLDGDGEQDEAPEHKAKIAAAAKSKPSEGPSKDDKIAAASGDQKKPPFAKSEDLRKDLDTGAGALMKRSPEKGVHPPAVGRKTGSSNMGLHSNVESKKRITREVTQEARKMPKPNLPKSEVDKCGEMRPSLKKFMLKRKMKKSGAPTSDERQGEKMSGSPAAPSPAEKIKAQPKLEMEKNKPVEKLMGIAPKAGK